MKKRVLLVGLAAVLAACGGDSTGPQGITGNYTLRTANGSNLPVVVVQNASYTDEITAGNVNMSADKTWIGLFVLRRTIHSGAMTALDIPLSGTYTNDNGSVVLSAYNGERLVGTASGGTLAVTDGPSLTLVYKR